MKNADGSVYYTCPFVPAEWIAAYGMKPRRVAPPGSPSGAPIGNLTGLCPFARAFANFAARQADAAAVIVTTACDQMRRIADLIAASTETPLFVMDVPHTWQETAAVKMYVSELRRLGRFLEKLGGTAPTVDGLRACVLEYDQGRKALRDASGLVSARRWAEISAEFHLTGMVPGFTLSSYKPAGAPLALVGGPLLGDRLDLFDLIEEAGGHVALNATEAGELTLPAPIDRRLLGADPPSALAEAYFGFIPAAFRRPNSLLFDRLREEIGKRGIRGVVLHRFVWCDTWHAEARRLHDWLPVPVVDLDASDEGYDVLRTRTRLGAFMEGLG